MSRAQRVAILAISLAFGLVRPSAAGGTSCPPPSFRLDLDQESLAGGGAAADFLAEALAISVVPGETVSLVCVESGYEWPADSGESAPRNVACGRFWYNVAR
jgi:hypothetical protein